MLTDIPLSSDDDEDNTTIGSVDTLASSVMREANSIKTAPVCSSCNKNCVKAKFYQKALEITSTTGDTAMLCLDCRIRWIANNEEVGAIEEDDDATITKTSYQKQFPKLKGINIETSMTKRGFKGSIVNLYRVRDVLNAARQVYGGWVGIQQRQLEIRQNKINRETLREGRKEEIFKILNANGADALRLNELDMDVQKYVQQARVPKRKEIGKGQLRREFLQGKSYQ